MLEKLIAPLPGVRGLANGVVVKYGAPSYRSDTEIAAAVADALQVSAAIDLAAVNIQVQVSQGWVTLEGLVSAMRQRAAAESSIIKLRGIRGVTNNIAIKRSATVIEAVIPKGAVAYPAQHLSRLH
jgi:osmotically-inducible protein OsmY